MLADFFNLITRRPPADYERRFVREVTVRTRPPRNRRIERMLVAAWILVSLKSAAMVWLFHHYVIPVSVWWVIGPTVAFTALCTAVYFARY